jgi:hypothetical protein
MQTIINNTKRLWSLAVANKKISIAIVVAIIIAYELLT